jgi:predicted TIM-barrel fold metal-dependent hydrolase
MCSEPHAGGLPDLVDHHWDPLWELCTELELPINLHVGASEFGMEAFMKGVWPSLSAERRHVVGCVQIEMHNGRILSNLLTSDLLVRFPETKWVSVESGIGWIPYVIERLEYQLRDTTPDGRGFDQPMPSELFRRQVYATFWFEDAGPSKLLEDVGFDNVMFETDFPHPTCLYPNAVEHALKVLEPWGPEVTRKVMQDNAAQLYHIPV